MLGLCLRVYNSFLLVGDVLAHRHRELKRYVSEKTTRSK